MPDVLVRDVPKPVLGRIDSKAKRAGLSRNEYLNRMFAADQADDELTWQTMHEFSAATAAVNDPDVMAGAWS
jgi:hypothetical protein